MVINKKVTRGVRNNNPLNIRIGNTWLGEVPKPTETAFEQFVSVEYGLRAAFCILRRYIKRYGHNTVAKIIRTWAPANENNTQQYINYVCAQMKIGPDDIISYSDRETMCALVGAMAKMESACNLSEVILIKSYNLA